MKRKNFIWSLSAIMMAAMLSGGLVACSSDDDDDASDTSGVLDNELGLRVMSVGNYKYTYMDDGRLDYVMDRRFKYEFSYSPNRIDSMDVSYTSKGYLKSVSQNTKSNQASANYTYDGDGHLTKITSSVKGEDDNYRCDVTLTWKNDLLRKIVWIDEYYDDGDTYTDRYTSVFEYDVEKNVENLFLQFAPSLMQFSGLGDGEIEEALAYVGMLGKGPKYLPSSCETEVEEDEGDGKVDRRTRTKTFQYGFNIDGALSYVTINSERINYKYDFLDN